MTPVKTLYFDESGQTGTKLLDVDQPYFSVGSTDIPTDGASTIIEKYFPRHAGSDLKFRTLFRRASNHAALIEFAKFVGQNSDHFFCFLIDKRFAILARMVDWLVEPVVSATGYDWYKDDYGRRWVNMFHFGLCLPENEGLLAEMMALYNSFGSNVSSETLNRMQTRFTQIAKQGPETLRPFMTLVAEGANAFAQHYSLETFNKPHDANDVHVASIVSSVGWWRSRHIEDFEVIHDQSTHFFKRQGLWDRVSSMEASDGRVRVGAKSLSFPLRVLSTKEGDSKLLPSLQLCDLVAGFVAKAKSAKLDANETEVIGKMIAAGIGQLNFDSVSPGDEFIDGPPAAADGPDVVDQIAMITRRH